MVYCEDVYPVKSIADDVRFKAAETAEQRIQLAVIIVAENQANAQLCQQIQKDLVNEVKRGKD